MNHNEAADELLGDAAIRFPTDTMVQSMWVDAALRRNDLKAAEQRAATVRERLPDQSVGFTLGARVLRDSGQADRARELLIDARRRWPNDRHLRRAEAEDAMNRRDWAAADRLWAEVRAAEPADVAGWLGGAASLREAGQNELADAMLRDAQERFTTSVSVYAMLATLGAAPPRPRRGDSPLGSATRAVSGGGDRLYRRRTDVAGRGPPG